MALLDLSDVVSDLADMSTLTVTRPAAASYTLGRLDTPSTSSFTIDASVQPVSGRDLKRLPEGTRVADARTVYTTTELKPQPSDLVTIAGVAYQVHASEDWASVGGYWKALILKTGH